MSLADRATTKNEDPEAAATGRYGPLGGLAGLGRDVGSPPFWPLPPLRFHLALPILVDNDFLAGLSVRLASTPRHSPAGNMAANLQTVIHGSVAVVLFQAIDGDLKHLETALGTVAVSVWAWV